MEALLQALVIPASLLVFGSALSWFISSQFTSVRKLIYEQIKQTEDTLLTKFDYHERHDDQRFDSISKDLWEIRVSNAARDRVSLEDRKEINKKQ